MDTTVAARIHQRSEAVFRNLVASAPVAVLVRDGQKQVATKTGSYTAQAGSVSLLPDRIPLEICNRLGAEGGYCAATIVIPRHVIVQTKADCHLSATNDSRVVGAFERALISCTDPLVPEHLRAHYVQEVLLWLAEVGIYLPPSRKETVVDRVRALINTSLDTAWKADDVAARLGLSEASLRRQMASNGTSFSALLSDVRMTQALALLQSTDLSINRIALEVGYASPSKFAARFRDRFDVAPSAIRSGALIRSGQDLIG